MSQKLPVNASVSNTKTDLILLHVASFVLCFAGLFAKWIQLPALHIIFGRSLVAFPILLGIACWTRSMSRILLNKDRWIVGSAGVLLMVHWVTFYMAIQVSTVFVGVVCFYSYVVMNVLLEPLVVSKRLSWVQWVQAVGVVLGVMIVFWDASAMGNVGLGILYGLVSALSFSVRNILLRFIVNAYPSSWLMTLQVGIGVLILGPFSFSAFVTAPVRDIIITVIAGVLITGLAHTLYMKSLRSLSATTVGIIASCQVVYAGVAAWLLLGEVISIQMFIGGSIVVAMGMIEHLRVK
jgi:drug/metabolite transporter (DMT)-like permease